MKKIVLLVFLIATSLCAFSQNGGKKGAYRPETSSRAVLSKKSIRNHGYLPYKKNRNSGAYDCSDFGFGRSSYQKETFVTANVSYSMKPAAAFGVTFGMMRRFGWFVSVMSSPNFKSFSTDGEFDRDNASETKPFLKGDSYRKDTRLSLMAGILFRVARPVALRVGVGYGIDEMCYEATDGQWFKDKVNCQRGLDTSLGVQCSFGSIVVSADAVATDFKRLEAKIGVGYSF